MATLATSSRGGERQAVAREDPGTPTPAALNRALLAETLKHPLTLYPALMAAAGGVYMGLAGPDPLSFTVTFGSAFFGSGVWVINHFLRWRTFARRCGEKLRARWRREQDAVLGQLEEAWQEIGHREGLLQTRELGEAYLRLDGFLARRHSGPYAERLRVLAKDTYREGLDILRLALELARALSVIQPQKLRAELDAWRRQLLEASRRGEQDPRLRGHQTRIAGHERRLELYAERTASLAELLAQCEALETALETTYLQVVDLGSSEALLARGDAAGALERAVEAARRVERRMRGLEQAPKDADRQYLEAAGS